MRICFSVPGVPVAKGRPRFVRRGAHVAAYTPSKTADYERLVGHRARYAMLGFACLTGAVGIELHAYLAIPKSWSKKKRAAALDGSLYPTANPDIDNYAKSTIDAMNSIVFKDDGQVVELFVQKRYAEEPRMVVTVWPMDGDVWPIQDNF